MPYLVPPKCHAAFAYAVFPCSSKVVSTEPRRIVAVELVPVIIRLIVLRFIASGTVAGPMEKLIEGLFHLVE